MSPCLPTTRQQETHPKAVSVDQAISGERKLAVLLYQPISTEFECEETVSRFTYSPPCLLTYLLTYTMHLSQCWSSMKVLVIRLRCKPPSCAFPAHCQLGLPTRKPPFGSIVNPNCVRCSMLPLYKFRERKNGVQTRIWPLNVDPPSTPRTLIHGESVLRCCPVKFALCINDD